MEYHQRRAYGVLGGSMKEEEKEAIEKLTDMWEKVMKAIDVLDKRISALEKIVYSDVEFIPDFIAEEGN